MNFFYKGLFPLEISKKKHACRYNCPDRVPVLAYVACTNYLQHINI